MSHDPPALRARSVPDQATLDRSEPHRLSPNPNPSETPPEATPGRRRLIPVADAASYLGVSRATVERLVLRGDLPVVKVGGSTRYELGDLDRFIDTNRRRNRRR
jgi:excisionase family DNA binding protein